MKERPILFSGPMVRAILDGTKTQTRRVMKRQRQEAYNWTPTVDDTWVPLVAGDHGYDLDDEHRCPYGLPGDRLWVREKHIHWANHYLEGEVYEQITYDFADDDQEILWRGNGKPPTRKWWNKGGRAPWTPSIFMPRRYSRIDLEITEVRVERVQEIAEGDAIAEGLGCTNEEDCPICAKDQSSKEAFAELWDSINSKRGFGWDENPWVWALTFRVVK